MAANFITSQFGEVGNGRSEVGSSYFRIPLSYFRLRNQLLSTVDMTNLR